MKKCAYMVGIVLFILLLSGCGEVKSELRYDYTKNLTYSGEDKASETFSAIAIKIIEAVNLCQEEVDLSEFDMPDIIIDTAFNWAVQSDPMCLFAELKNKEGGVYSIEYIGGDEEHKNRVAQFEIKVNDILNTYVIPGNDEETVRQLYDNFVSEMEYDYILFSDWELNTQQGQMPTEIDILTRQQSVFNPLINQAGLCDGLSKSFAFLLNQIGIENYLVSDKGSTAIFASNNPEYDGQPDSMGHMWNLIKLNDEFYHFDITFEIGVIEEWEDEYGNDHLGVKSEKKPLPHLYYGMSDVTRDASRESVMRLFQKSDLPVYVMVGVVAIETLPISEQNLPENSQLTEQEYESNQDTDSLLDAQLLVKNVEVNVEILSSEEQDDRDTFVLKNDLNDTHYKLNVIFPTDYSDSKTYPVVYMLDGNLEGKEYTQRTQENLILVTIGYEDENQFYELRKTDYLDQADIFLNVLINGMIPFVEGNYSIDENQRSLFGWACGANFAAFAMFQSDGVAKNVFSEYVICNPIMKQNCVDRSLFAYEYRYFERGKSLPVTVKWAVAGKVDSNLLVWQQDLLSTIERREYTDIDLTIRDYEECDLYQVWDQALEDFVFGESVQMAA